MSCDIHYCDTPSLWHTFFMQHGALCLSNVKYIPVLCVIFYGVPYITVTLFIACGTYCCNTLSVSVNYSVILVRAVWYTVLFRCFLKSCSRYHGVTHFVDGWYSHLLLCHLFLKWCSVFCSFFEWCGIHYCATISLNGVAYTYTYIYICRGCDKNGKYCA